MALRSVVEEREPAYVSTGHLPDPETMQALVNEAQRRFQSNQDGTTSRVYPRLPVSPAGEPTAAASEAPALGVLVASRPPSLRLAPEMNKGGRHDDVRS